MFNALRAITSSAVILLFAGLAWGQPAPSERPFIASYYFPNYHPTDNRNQKIKGAGWSEWELVKAARPRFEGHQQPNVPLWGYVDESDPKVMEKKIDAAADHGVDAFIYDWYYYDDGLFLEKGLEQGFMKAGNARRMKFGLMWANHDWIEIHPWRPGPRNTLFPGKITPRTWDVMTDYIIKTYFKHPSYWMIDGKPYFSVYDLNKFMESFGSVQATREAMDGFRAKCKAAGFVGAHLNAVVWGRTILPVEKTIADPAKLIKDLGFDSVTSYVWIHHVGLSKFPQTDYAVARDGYMSYWDKAQKMFAVPYYPNVTMGWDSTPRVAADTEYKNASYPSMAMMGGNTPEQFEKALEITRDRILKNPAKDRIITINCWNEWTEGSYLEPDTVHKMAYLEAIKKVFGVAK